MCGCRKGKLYEITSSTVICAVNGIELLSALSVSLRGEKIFALQG